MVLAKWIASSCIGKKGVLRQHSSIRFVLFREHWVLVVSGQLKRHLSITHCSLAWEMVGKKKGEGGKRESPNPVHFSWSPLPSIHHPPLLFIVVILSVAEGLHAFFRDTFFALSALLNAFHDFPAAGVCFIHLFLRLRRRPPRRFSFVTSEKMRSADNYYPHFQAL